MYMDIEDLKKAAPKAVSFEDYIASLKEEEPTIILRDYDEPQDPPCLQGGVEVFDFAAHPRPADDVAAAYGTHGTIPGIEVVNAIKAALGPGPWSLHISDGSYTRYSIWELKEFMNNFDNTDLRVWIAEVFDCDDFSQVLQGNVNGFFPGIPFGTIWYGPRKPPWWGHSVNIFYSFQDKKVYLVEPQNDAFYLFNKTLWKPWMVIM